jgi:hypothetical protein
MRRRIFAYAGWVVAGFALLGGATAVKSQSTFPEGAFVRAQDNTEWVVSGGNRFQITWMPDDNNVVPRLQRGPSVSTAGQLSAAIAAAPPAPAPTATPAPEPPAPAAAAAPAPPAPTEPACNLASETTTTSTDNGTVTITTNFNGVQGLTQQVVVLSAGSEAGSFTSFSIPAWLQSAYNGNIEAIYRDIASGVLVNRCAS